MSDENITQRLSEHSTKVNVNAMQIALLEQRVTIVERRMDEYHQRLHEAEDDILKMKVVQEIHDTEIKVLDKMLIGNGTRETIPMDIDRMSRAISDILKVDTKAMNIKIETLLAWQQLVSNRSWQIWMIVIGLVISQIWQWVTP
jgi:chromosome segregation ATPase